jgi:glutaredoxin 3
MSQPVTLYTTGWCPFCMRAKALLQRKGIAYTEIDIESRRELRQEMIERSGRRSVPQVFIGDHHVGGADDLAALDASGELDRLLAQPAGATPASQTETTATRN